MLKKVNCVKPVKNKNYLQTSRYIYLTVDLYVLTNNRYELTNHLYFCKYRKRPLFLTYRATNQTITQSLY